MIIDSWCHSLLNLNECGIIRIISSHQNKWLLRNTGLKCVSLKVIWNFNISWGPCVHHYAHITEIQTLQWIIMPMRCAGIRHNLEKILRFLRIRDNGDVSQKEILTDNLNKHKHYASHMHRISWSLCLFPSLWTGVSQKYVMVTHLE